MDYIKHQIKENKKTYDVFHNNCILDNIKRSNSFFFGKKQIHFTFLSCNKYNMKIIISDLSNCQKWTFTLAYKCFFSGNENFNLFDVEFHLLIIKI